MTCVQQQIERWDECETDGMITEKESNSNKTMGGQFRQRLQERERQEINEKSSLSEKRCSILLE